MTTMTMTKRAMVLSILAAVAISACGGRQEPVSATDPSGSDATADERRSATDGAPAGEPGAMADGTPAEDGAAEPGLVMPAHWMPADWDRNVHHRSGSATERGDPSLERQRTLSVVPFVLWALGHHSQLDEAYQPAWVWWSALRSCEHGIQLMEDLTGEFGDRARAAAALSAARKELKEFAATQPDDFTLYMSNKLGRWDERTGSFHLIGGSAWAIDPRKVQRELPGNYMQGISMEVADSRGKMYVVRLVAGEFDSNLYCDSPDGKTSYTFSMQTSWYLYPGARRDGYTDTYSPPAQLPDIPATREQAAAWAQRNPEREVMVAITVGADGGPIGTNQGALALSGVLRKVVVTDAKDGSILVSKTY